MKNQALSLRYRPQNFDALVGQKNILLPLINSLNQQKLHHAYLLTGIRGVGKTSIARIIAKSLNCIQKLSATPCDECEHCAAIRNGNFPDVIEIDAASRTRVEETKEILDLLAYQPLKSRFKVLIIDEVHMLSTHSFNALLKTLEDPPSHVKFILATTDPEKIPATVISRCLQYHLQRIDPDFISDHLEKILSDESIDYEKAALNQIALASEGSMRDALSLLEQATYLGTVKHDAVLDMLGLTKQKQINQLLIAIAEADLNTALESVNQLFKQGAQLKQVIEQLIATIHELAIYKANPELATLSDPKLSQLFSQENLQIMYQSCLISKRDIALSPSEKAALEMLLLRLIYFMPAKENTSAKTNITRSADQNEQNSKKVQSIEATTHQSGSDHATPMLHQDHKDWDHLLAQLNLSGMTQEIASHAILKTLTDTQLELLFESNNRTFISNDFIDRVEAALAKHFKKNLKLTVSFTEAPLQETPSAMKQKASSQEREKQLNTLQKDEGIQILQSILETNIIPESIQTTSKE